MAVPFEVHPKDQKKKKKSLVHVCLCQFLYSKYREAIEIFKQEIK